MLKTVQRRTAVLSCCAAILCPAALSLADELQAVPAGQHLTPIRAAVLNADMSMRGDWIDYREALAQRGGVACSAIETLSYDCFQADIDGVTPIGGDTDCGLAEPYERFFLTNETCLMRSADDFTLETGFGGQITRITGAFYWFGDGNPANNEQCFIVLQIWDEIDATCTGPAINNKLGNVILDLGLLQNNPGNYYTFDIDICAINSGDGISAPIDGAGAVDIILARQFSEDTSTLVLATCAQPMLWGTANDRPGSQTNLPYWYDVDRSAGFEAPSECFTFDGFAECPKNIGTMVALYTASTEVCDGAILGDVNGDCVVDTADLGILVGQFNTPSYCADLNSDGIVDTADLGQLISNFGSSCAP